MNWLFDYWHWLWHWQPRNEWRNVFGFWMLMVPALIFAGPLMWFAAEEFVESFKNKVRLFIPMLVAYIMFPWWMPLLAGVAATAGIIWLVFPNPVPVIRRWLERMKKEPNYEFINRVEDELGWDLTRPPE